MANEKTVMAVIRAARPSFRNNHDKIAFAVHASFLASGYILTATGPAAFSDTAFSSPSTGTPLTLLSLSLSVSSLCNSDYLKNGRSFWRVDEVGMDNWQELDDEYAFVYTNPEKGLKKVLVKCLAMHDKLLVDALAEGASEPVHLEIRFDFPLLSLHSQLDIFWVFSIFLFMSSYEFCGVCLLQCRRLCCRKRGH